jgi:hypothetical protein
LGIRIKYKENGEFVFQVFVPEKDEYGPEIPMPEEFAKQEEAAAMIDGRLPNPFVV